MQQAVTQSKSPNGKAASAFYIHSRQRVGSSVDIGLLLLVHAYVRQL